MKQPKLLIMFIFLFLISIANIIATVDDAKIYLDMDVNGTIADTSGFNNNAVINGATFNTSYKLGYGAYNIAPLKNITVANSSTTDNSGDYTYSFWSRYNDTATAWFFSYDQYLAGHTGSFVASLGGQYFFGNQITACEKQDVALTTGSYQHIVLRRIGNNIELWVNGTNASSIVGGCGAVTTGKTLNIGGAGGGLTTKYQTIDEFVYYQRALTPTEIGQLYNAGVGFNPYPSSFNPVQFVLPTPSNSTYYNATHNYIEVNVTTTYNNLSNTTLRVYRNDVLINSTYNITGNFTTNFTGLITGTYKINATAYNTTNSTSTETRTIYIGKSQINITAYNTSGSLITTFNATVNSVVYPTTTGYVYYQANIGDINNITIISTGYAYDVGTIIVNNTTSVLYNRILYPEASIFITIYDENSTLKITQNITVTLTDVTNPRIITGSTVTSMINFTGLTYNNDVYEVKFTSVNYSTSRVYRIVLTNYSDVFNAYLLLNTLAQNLTICFYNVYSNPIKDLHLFENYLVNTSYILAQDDYTDILGKVLFTFNPAKYYYYNISSTIYTMNPFILNPPDNTVVTSNGCNYEVTLVGSTTSYNFTTPNVTGYIAYDNNTRILNFSYIGYDTPIPLENFSYTISKVVSGVYFTTICSGNSTSNSALFSCNITNYYGVAYIQGVVDGRIFYGSWFDMGANNRIFGDITNKDSAFIGGFILLLMVFGAIIFGITSSLIVLVAGLLIIYWLQLFTVLNVTIIIIGAIVSLIIGFSMKGRK
jgi:hypothetical protein